MEKKNTVLLTVIAVATLLVAVVGATFAYFTATTEGTGQGESANVTTTTVGNVTLNMSATTTSNDLQYPGGYLVVGAKVTGAHTGTAAYNTTYTVNGTVDATNVSTDLTWTLYEISSAVAAPVSGCEIEEDTTSQAGETRYYYTGCTVSATITGGTKVDEGTATAGETATITVANEALTTAAGEGASTYYYLVVEYPNSGNQNADQGKTITAALTSISNGTAATA